MVSQLSPSAPVLSGTSRRPLLGRIAAALLVATAALGATSHAQIFSENFDDGAADGFTFTPGGLWHVTENFPSSGTHSLGFVQNETPGTSPNGDFEAGNLNETTFSSAFLLPAEEASLSFNVFLHQEGSDFFDRLTIGVSLDGTTIDKVFASSAPRYSGGQIIPLFSGNSYFALSISLAEYAGQSVQLAFNFATIDGIFNSYPGARVDDVVVAVGTANHLPVAVDDIYTVLRNRNSIPVLDNDSDPDGEPLTIVSVTSNSGNAHTDGAVIFYQPSSATGTDEITYVVSDPSGGHSIGNVEVTLDVQARTEILFKGATGGATPALGDVVPGEPAEITFKTVGIPDLNDLGDVAFVATLKTSAGNVPAIFDGQSVVVRKGDEVPGLTGLTFSAFKDPVLDNDGEVTFRATLKGAGVSSSNSQGLFTNQAGNDLTLITRTGDAIPGIQDSQLGSIKAFISTDETVFFTALLVNKIAGASPGPGGVTSTDDFILCSWTPTAGVQVLLREGADFGGQPVKTFAALAPSSGSSGHGRTPLHPISFNEDPLSGSVLARVSFTDGSQSIVAVGQETVSIAESGQAAYTDGPIYKGFGLPIVNNSQDFAALATLSGEGVSGANNVGIFGDIDDSDANEVFRKGTDFGGLNLYGFKDPVMNGAEDFATIVSLKAPGLTSANNKGILANFDGDVQLVARLGNEPTGVSEAQWKAFKSLALPDGFGPLFVATMVKGASGAPGPGGVTSTTDAGLWLTDANGNVSLLVREGDILDVAGTPKTIKSFKALTAVSGSPGQTRSFNDGGEFVYLATFTDGSKAIVRMFIPFFTSGM